VSRTIRRTPGAVVLLLTVFVLVTIPAEATYHAVGHNVYGDWLGAYAEWPNPQEYYTYDTSSNNDFTAQVMWVATEGAVNGYWVEVGLTKGWKDDTSIWTFYWAEMTTSSYAEYRVDMPVGAKGDNHSYQVQYTGYNEWTAYIDFQPVGISAQAPPCVRVDVGAEVVYSGNMLTTTYPQHMQVLDRNTGTWEYWKDSGGTIMETDDPPFHWEWRDPGTYKLGKDFKL